MRTVVFGLGMLCAFATGAVSSSVAHYLFGLSPSNYFNVYQNGTLIITAAPDDGSGTMTFSSTGGGSFEVVQTNIGPTSAPPAPGPIAGLRGVSPSPTSGRFSVNYAAAAGTPVTVEVFDPLGRCLGARVFRPQTGGVGRCQIDLQSMVGRRLAGGAYLLRIHLGAQTCTRRLIVVPAA